MWSFMNQLSTRRSIPRIIRYFSIMAASSDFPSSLTGSPTLALVPPGKCQFSSDLTLVPLLKKWEISPTSFVLRFGLPDASKSLNLSTCACILAYDELPDRNGNLEGVVRPYTPISTNAQIGSFDLLVKNYGDHGRMSTHLCSLEVGKEIAFKHVDGNVKIQAPFAYKKVCMLVGGTGITPMVQALHAILGDPTSDVEVVVLYGSRESRDILGKDLLDSWIQQHPHRLTVEHILSDEPENSNWAGARGHITKDLIQKHFPPPADNSMILFICGPPPMYSALCGPREEKKLSGLLNEMGYSANQVYKF
jgi:cytochrome-b5 reductase